METAVHRRIREGYREALMQLFFGAMYEPTLACRSQVRDLLAWGLALRTPSGYVIITAQGVEECLANGWDIV